MGKTPLLCRKKSLSFTQSKIKCYENADYNTFASVGYHFMLTKFRKANIFSTMHKSMKSIFLLATMILLPLASNGQSSLTLSTPILWSNVSFVNNWSPPTAINRQNEFNGNSVGYGVNLNYSFHPPLFISNKNILLDIGLGFCLWSVLSPNTKGAD